MLRNGTQVDPLKLVSTGGDPVPAAEAARWGREMLDRLALLEVLPGPNETRYATNTSGAAGPSGLQERPSNPATGGGR
jgi:hypothetical protein